MPSRRRTIGVPKTGDSNTFGIVTCGTTGGTFDPAELAVLIARAILGEVAKERVILTGRMPKSVALAVGRLLWEHSADDRSRRDFWRRFVPLVWSESDYAFRYLRVDYAQPTAADLGIG